MRKEQAERARGATSTTNCVSRTGETGWNQSLVPQVDLRYLVGADGVTSA